MLILKRMRIAVYGRDHNLLQHFLSNLVAACVIQHFYSRPAAAASAGDLIISRLF